MDELDRVVDQLEQHSEHGLLELFSLFDTSERFVAHFRIDRYPPDTGFLGFHGGSFEAVPALGKTFLEGSLLLLEATLATYGWNRVLSSCLATNRATSHFLSGLGFQERHVARSQRVIGGHRADVAHFCLPQNAYLGNRMRRRLVGDRRIVTLPENPNKAACHSAASWVNSQDALHHSVMKSCREVLAKLGSAGAGSRLRTVEKHIVAPLLGPAITAILARWKLYTGLDAGPEGLDDLVAAWDTYTHLMALLPICVLDGNHERPVAFFVVRLFPGNHSLAEITGGGLPDAAPTAYASEMRTLLCHFLTGTGLCRVQATVRGAPPPWHSLLGFSYEGCDHEGNAVYSLVSDDLNAPC